MGCSAKGDLQRVMRKGCSHHSESTGCHWNRGKGLSLLAMVNFISRWVEVITGDTWQHYNRLVDDEYMMIILMAMIYTAMNPK